MTKPKKNDHLLNDFADKIWPGTRKELEKVIESTRAAIDNGEKYIKILSRKSVDNAKKISISFKKERLYYDLGKAVALTPKSKWAESTLIANIVDELKQLDQH